MSKTIRTCLISGILLLFIAVSFFTFLSSNSYAAQAPGCFAEKRGGTVERLPICNHDISDAGFDMGSLPNPLDTTKCYFWPDSASAAGQEVPCSDSRIASAQEWGGSVPPPAALAKRPSSASASDSLQFNTEEIDPYATLVDGQDCPSDQPLNSGNCKIVQYVVYAINGMSAIVGVVIVIMIIVGGMQYSAAQNDPQAVSAAKKKISNAVLALIIYIFMFAFLQWIVPGGLL
jgi:uncharacterized membrane protein